MRDPLSELSVKNANFFTNYPISMKFTNMIGLGIRINMASSIVLSHFRFLQKRRKIITSVVIYFCQILFLIMSCYILLMNNQQKNLDRKWNFICHFEKTIFRKIDIPSLSIILSFYFWCRLIRIEYSYNSQEADFSISLSFFRKTGNKYFWRGTYFDSLYLMTLTLDINGLMS